MKETSPRSIYAVRVGAAGGLPRSARTMSIMTSKRANTRTTERYSCAAVSGANGK